jgi:hypothetical protein
LTRTHPFLFPPRRLLLAALLAAGAVAAPFLPSGRRALALIPPRLCARVDGIRVEGTPAFVARARQALALLHATRSFAAVRPYVAVIRESPHSGMRADAAEPTYEVGAATWQHSSIWFAGSIAHDGYHSLLYHQARARNHGRRPPRAAWTGAAAERCCLQHQLAALREMNADERLLHYVEHMIADPTYQDVEYGKRNW